MNKTAVIFFSRDGSTRIAARLIAARLNEGKTSVKIIELTEQKPSRGFIRSGFRASTKKHSVLAGDPWKEIEDCSTLVIGSPIWAGNGNPVLNGFFDKAVLPGKKVYLFTLQADPGKSKSKEVLDHFTDRVKASGGIVAGTLALSGAAPGKTAEESTLKKALGVWPFS